MRKFPRTFHTLDSERPGVSIAGLTLVSFLFVAWMVWLFGARISVFEVTPLGRLEVDRAAYPITSRVDGRVTDVPMTMGRRIRAGEVLVRLETRELEIQLEEEQSRQTSIERELEATRKEIELRRKTLNQNRQGSKLAAEEARTRQREAEIQADFADQEAERARILFEDGQVSRQEVERQRSEADRLQESKKTHELTSRRREADIRVRELTDQTEVAVLNRELAKLEGDARTVMVTLDRIRYNIDQHSIRAPQDGEIGDVIDLPVMSLVRAGDRLGTILASGEIRVIGEFAAASALGRIHPGQSARVRLDGFPWTQYGMLSATVARAAREPRAGRLRVELDVDAGVDASPARLPIQHGLTGTVEVEVERISPLALLLRTLGKALSPTPVLPEASERLE